MISLIVTIIVVISVLLVLVVLAQNPKGGAGSVMGGSTASSMMGARRTSDWIEKSTWYLGGALMILCLATSFYISADKKGEVKSGSANMQKAKESGGSNYAPIEEEEENTQDTDAQPSDDEAPTESEKIKVEQ